MKYLLYAAITGFSCWMISEIIEIIHGYNSTVFLLTSGYHLFAGIGIWGLYGVQKSTNNRLGRLSTLVSSIAYIGLVYFPIQIMQSGLTFPEYMEANPVYKIPGAIWFLGMILFGISLLRTRFYPTWTAVIFLLGTIMFTATPLLGWPGLLVNFTNIVFSLAVIYMGIFGLNRLSKSS